ESLTICEMERKTMDHNEALRSQACEKYLLGELPTDQRDAFEEHYFSCSECARQLQTAADFLSASREILAERLADLSVGTTRTWPGFWAMLRRPAFAVPVFAALLLLIGYQNFVVIPKLQRPSKPRAIPMFSLISANVRGENDHTFPVSANEPFGVYFDVPVHPEYSSYVIRLVDPSGTATLLPPLSSAEAEKTQFV